MNADCQNRCCSKIQSQKWRTLVFCNFQFLLQGNTYTVSWYQWLYIPPHSTLSLRKKVLTPEKSYKLIRYYFSVTNVRSFNKNQFRWLWKEQVVWEAEVCTVWRRYVEHWPTSQFVAASNHHFWLLSSARFLCTRFCIQPRIRSKRPQLERYELR